MEKVEKEIKFRILEGDKEEILRTLKEFSKYEGKEKQVDIYFSHPQKDYAVTDEALRLRKSGERVELTYKGPKFGQMTKSREELSVDISSLEMGRLILERLGFNPRFTVEKERENFSYKNLIISVDTVSGLGLFLEVEAKEGGMGEKELLRESINILERLRVKWKIENSSYLEMLLKEAEGVNK